MTDIANPDGWENAMFNVHVQRRAVDSFGLYVVWAVEDRSLVCGHWTFGIYKRRL
jgi:hypothetical protein